MDRPLLFIIALCPMMRGIVSSLIKSLYLIKKWCLAFFSMLLFESFFLAFFAVANDIIIPLSVFEHDSIVPMKGPSKMDKVWLSSLLEAFIIVHNNSIAFSLLFLLCKKDCRCVSLSVSRTNLVRLFVFPMEKDGRRCSRFPSRYRPEGW